jgi:GT2 family glycosyltransferase
MIKTGGRAGFSKGNNMAVNAFLSEKHNSIMLLNNDTIVQNGAIKLLKQCLLDGDRVGAVGPCMPYTGMTNKIWACGGYINKWKLSIGGLQPKSNRAYEVDYLPGAAVLTRADLWKKIGGLSEKYFFAYEEAEYALEVKQHGYKIMVEPKSVILHKVGISSQKKAQYFYNGIRNKIIFSKYLYGEWFGFIYGLFMTAISLRSKNPRIFFGQSRLWIEAIFDELRSKPVTQLRLNDIASRYEKEK